jgi:hypothetical protein
MTDANTTAATTKSSADFEPDCRSAFDALRGALLELYSNVGADPGSPQDVARRFGVNKTLTWNVSKVMTSSDPIATLPQVPGVSALGSLLQSMQKHGAAPQAVERVRNAVKELHQVVELHVGDRATLELIVDGLGHNGDDRLELSRKLAFRGNSGLWGVQAKTRMMTVYMSPNKDQPDHLDIAIVRGYISFRRLRRDVRWPVFQTRGWGNESDPITKPWKALDDDNGPGDRLPLLTQFSTVSAEALDQVSSSNGVDYMLAPGPIGNAGAVDCFIADAARSAVGIYRTEQDTTGEFGATISAPTERLIFDMVVHESLDFALRPEVRAFGGVFHDRNEEAVPEGHVPIPVPQTIADLPGRPPVVATPHVLRYTDIFNHVCMRMQWNPKTMRGCRYELTYPPLGSTILLRFKLPERPKK